MQCQKTWGSIVVLLALPLCAEVPLGEIKVSFERVHQEGVQGVPKAGDVSGAWSGKLEAGGKLLPLYLKLREAGTVFTGAVGLREGKLTPILDLVVRDGAVRFSLSSLGRLRMELTLKEDGRLEGRLISTADGPLSGNFVPSRDAPSIGYKSKPLRDPAAELNRRLEAGELRLKFDRKHGYLRSVVEAFQLPVESQVAVFSNTSAQFWLINPANPRTVFFNDVVSIGWIHGGEFIEVAAQDPEQGVIFYALDQKRVDKPRFERRDRCLNCHVNPATLMVPGLVIYSIFPRHNGTEISRAGSTDHRTPLERRWGGWYVTGTHGSARHLGNAFVTDPENPLAMVTDATLNVESLQTRFNTSNYLSPHSDITALMTLEHQAYMTNLITRMGWQVRVAAHDAELRKSLPAGTVDQSSAAAVEWLRGAAREFVDYLLFIDEAPLAGKIQGTSGFAAKFAAQGPRDGQGRGLRQFDLEKRLFRYPCSYMIYSPAFDALPPAARAAIYKRMWEVLSGDEKDERYARLSPQDRRDIVEILRETKKGLPDYFQAVTQAAPGSY